MDEDLSLEKSLLDIIVRSLLVRWFDLRVQPTHCRFRVG